MPSSRKKKFLHCFGGIREKTPLTNWRDIPYSGTCTHLTPSCTYNLWRLLDSIEHVHAKSLQSCPTLATSWIVSLQVPLSMAFSRQEDWSGLPCCPPGDLPNPGTEPAASYFSCSGRWVLYNWHHLGSLLGLTVCVLSGSLVSDSLWSCRL